MPILSHIERRAMEVGRLEGRQEGLLEGRQEGRLEGRQEGLLEGAREVLLEVLMTRFNSVPTELSKRVNQITEISTLKSLMKQAIFMGSLEEFERLIVESEGIFNTSKKLG